MSESKFYHFSPSGIFYNVGSASAAISVAREGGFIWLNFIEPQKEELSALVGPLGIHPLKTVLMRIRFPRSSIFPITHSSFLMHSAIQTKLCK
jgi:Mg2+ and Co2+ transporter CorA